MTVADYEHDDDDVNNKSLSDLEIAPVGWDELEKAADFLESHASSMCSNSTPQLTTLINHILFMYKKNGKTSYSIDKLQEDCFEFVIDRYLEKKVEAGILERFIDASGDVEYRQVASK